MTSKPASKKLHTALLVAAAISFLAPQMVLSADSKDLQMMLHGKIEEHGAVRIKRPETPTLESQTSTSGVSKSSSKFKVNVEASDFDKKFKELNPFEDAGKTAAEQAPPQAAAQSTGAEDDEMIIAWEAWHKRVCQVIYEHWMENSRIGGVAHTTITVTRDHRMRVTIHDVTVDNDILERLAGLTEESTPQRAEEFRNEVERTVAEIDGNAALEFPAKSRREMVEFEPYFSKEIGRPGYDWNKNDYEVVPVR